MRKVLRLLLAAGSLGLATSCYYTPYDYGYSDSYGFSGGGGTSFVYTSSDRWLYDSAVRCYYDRNRGCYYDPWVGGYYPRGYCPAPVSGMPHPYGWSGRGACPLPRNVHSRQIDRYQDRLALIRAKNYQWAEKVRAQRGATASRFQAQRAQQAANFRQAQEAQRERNQRARESMQQRNQRLRDAYQQNNRGYQPQNAAPRQPQRGGGNNRGSRQNTNARTGYTQPVNSAVQAQQQRNARLREAYSNSRQKQAAAYQKQKEALQNANQQRRGRGAR